MTKIVLISCVNNKLNHKAKAENIYTSPLFKYNIKYAKSLNPDKIYILSAKYGLLSLETEIKPYNKTLNKMTSKEIKVWANNVINKLNKLSNLRKDEFIILAGQKYIKYLIPHIKNYKLQLEGLKIGKRLEKIREISLTLFKEYSEKRGVFEKFTFPPEYNLPPGMKRGSDEQLLFITLTVALDYQRDAVKLWKQSYDAWLDTEKKWIFNPKKVVENGADSLIKLFKIMNDQKPTQDAKRIWFPICKKLSNFKEVCTNY